MPPSLQQAISRSAPATARASDDVEAARNDRHGCASATGLACAGTPPARCECPRCALSRTRLQFLAQRTGCGSGGVVGAGGCRTSCEGGLRAVRKRRRVQRVSGETPRETAGGGLAEPGSGGARNGRIRDTHCFDRGLLEGRRRAFCLVRRKRRGAESPRAAARRPKTAQNRARPKTFPTAYGPGGEYSPCDATLFVPSAAHDRESQLRRCGDAAVQRDDGRRSRRARRLSAAACASAPRASPGATTRRRL